MTVIPRRIIYASEKRLNGSLADFAELLSNGSERRLDEACPRNVIETEKRDILRDGGAERAQIFQHADCDCVVAAYDATHFIADRAGLIQHERYGGRRYASGARDILDRNSVALFK